MNTIFNNLQARYDNECPTDHDDNALHEDLTNCSQEVLTLLDQLEQKVNELHKLAECSEFEEDLSYTMYQLDTDTAQSELIKFISGDE